MKPSNFSDHFFLSKLPWEINNCSLWPTSLFTLRRNIAKHPFPHQQSEAQARFISERIQAACEKSPFLQNSIFLQLSELTPIQKEFVSEHFFIPEDILQDRPHQGVIVDASGSFIIGINLANHLTLHKIDYSASWHEAWNFLSKIENELSKHLDYAFSSKFGFLTSNIHHCGTALTVRAYLHLPALLQINQTDSSDEFTKNEDILITHMKSDAYEENQDIFEGDLVILQNRFHLGVSEDSVLHHLYNAATRLVNLERNSRSVIKSGNFPDIKDSISRSFGILLHSYQIPTSEAFAALSFLKLGADIGWVQGISDKEINNLFFQCRRGHILVSTKETLSHETLLHKRASIIHQALQQASLTI